MQWKRRKAWVCELSQAKGEIPLHIEVKLQAWRPHDSRLQSESRGLLDMAAATVGAKLKMKCCPGRVVQGIGSQTQRVGGKRKPRAAPSFDERVDVCGRDVRQIGRQDDKFITP